MNTAATSPQSCPTLCDSIDVSPRGSPVPEILQARTLEWVAIAFSNAWKWKVKVKSLSRVWLLLTPWTAAYQATPPMGFSRQEYWSGVPSPSPKNTWSNRQIWPWSTEWSRAKANRVLPNRVLPRERTGHSKHPLPTTQEKTLQMDITRWSTPEADWLYPLQQGWRSSIQSAKTRPGTDCGSDHELLIAKFRLKLKKVAKTTRPFRYDLNKSLMIIQ